MLIAICGIDGSGKTTQIKLLENYLKTTTNNDIVLTKQPTDFYRKYDRFKDYINRDNAVESESLSVVYELALLSATDKLRHYLTEILEREKNDIIISDRYVFSSYAYFSARGITDINWLKEINKYLPLPDITIYLDVPVEIACDRIINRDGKYTKKEETNLKVMSLVRENFLEQPWGDVPNYHIVEAGNASVLEVHNKIIEIIKKYI